MTHVTHKCKNTPEGLLVSLANTHGWDSDEIPLNTDAGHTVCPYCGTSTADMTALGAEDVFKLSKNLKAKGTSGVGGVAKGDTAELVKEVKSLRAAVEALKKGGSK